MFSRFSISYSATRESLIVNSFHLDRSVPFLVNISNLSRNLLRIAMSYFIPKISSIYIVRVEDDKL